MTCRSKPERSSGPARGKCKANSDENIFDGSIVAAPDYIGRHPGTGFMEMQFYPPSSPFGCGNPDHPNQWCAALNIDSASAGLQRLSSIPPL
jgi:hypothetical protein